MQQESKPEIERRFVVEPLRFDVSSFSGELVEQGYTPDGFRIRRIGSTDNQRFFRTEKKGVGLVRMETESTISREDFLQLWPFTVGQRVIKTRYKVPLKDLVAEVDVFGGELTGHVIVEVEFSSEQEAASFEIPSWFLADGVSIEVTNNPLYNNYSLAKKGWPENG